MPKAQPGNHTLGTFTFSFAALREPMKNRTLLIPAVGLFAITPAIAQDAGADAAADAAEAAEEAIEVAGDASGPPAIVVPPAAPPSISARAPEGKSRDAQPQDWQAISPKQSDYPSASWAAEEEGRVSYEVQVTPEGKPFNCVVTESSGSAALDSKTCDVVTERGTFEPALDDDGRPIEGRFDSAHNWRKREPEFPGSMTVRVQFVLDENGETQGCDVLEMSGQMPEGMKRSFEREPCPGTRNNRVPYRDENGLPVAKQVTVVFDITVEDPPE